MFAIGGSTIGGTISVGPNPRRRRRGPLLIVARPLQSKSQNAVRTAVVFSLKFHLRPVIGVPV
jgi:hypothetical protein